MALTERWELVSGVYEEVKPWNKRTPRDNIQIKIYGSKRYEKYVPPNVEFFSISDGKRIIVPLSEVMKLIEEYNNADPAEEKENDKSRDIE